jgi:hypothetical protein
MNSRQRRVRAIELTLTPQEIVVVWLRNALQAGTFEEGATHMPPYRGVVANAVYDTVRNSNNSTITGNSASSRGGLEVGGGISNGGDYLMGGSVTINNSTVTANSAQSNGGNIYTNENKVTIRNSIVANSTSGDNCSGTVTSDGYNLSSDDSCNFKSTGDLNNTDPKLGQLGNHGGPTQTVPLFSTSPAINAGNPSGCTDGHGHLLKTDQRGKPRPDKKSGLCDMGAYERQNY